jgi:integrase
MKPKSRGNGTGTAFKRGNTWTARVVLGWKLIGEPQHLCPIYKTKGGFKMKKDALKYCEVLLSCMAKASKAPTVEHYWNTYRDGEMESLSDSKKTAYRIAWDKMKDIHLRPIDSLSVADVRALVSNKAKTYYPARDMKILLGHLFDLAGADGWVNKDLPDYIILPALNEKERLPFTEKEQANLWKIYESGCKNAAIPLIMIYTGMMTGEMRRLTVEMVDFTNKRIVGVGLKTKVRRDAAIYVSSAILPVLQDVCEGKDGLVWNVSEMDFYALYYDALTRAGCRRLTPYSCRHTTATALAVTENIAPQTVRKIMRWSTTKMLDRYAHPSDTDAAAAVESLKKSPTNTLLITSTDQTLTK